MKVPDIFLQNDIRGIIDQQITSEFAYNLGRALADFFNNSGTIALGYDSRPSSKRLQKEVTNGIVEGGMNVVNVGLSPTPLIYYTCANNPETFVGGLIITASHNPPQFNGFKVCDNNGIAYEFESCYNFLKESMIAEEFSDGAGSVIEGSNYNDSYYEFLSKELEKVQALGSLKVFVEFGNGSTSKFQTVIPKSWFLQTYNSEPDGTFPNLVPDPTKPESFVNLLNSVNNGSEMSLGIVFDGDGDRVGFCVNGYGIVAPDHVIKLFAKDMLAQDPDLKERPILIDTKVSLSTKEYIQSLGGKVELSKVGHSWVQKKLHEVNACLAGELSSHYYFNDRYLGFDDGLYSAVRFIQILIHLQNESVNVNQLLNSLPSYFASKEYRIKVSKPLQQKIIKDLKSRINEKAISILEIDGLRPEFLDGWFLVRGSSTEEKLSFRVEGKSVESRDTYLNLIKEVLVKNGILFDY